MNYDSSISPTGSDAGTMPSPYAPLGTPMAPSATIGALGQYPCQEAGKALGMAIFSFFCVGFVLGPMAIKTGFEAREKILEDPSLRGWGKANAGIFLGIASLCLWALGMYSRFAA